MEGNSLRSTERITGHARWTINKLLISAGIACEKYQEKYLKNISSNFIEVDEIWSFVGCKERGLSRGKIGHGDIWTFVAIDCESKLVIHWETGDRGIKEATNMMDQLAFKINKRFQLTTDGYGKYGEAVEKIFRGEIDFAMAVKSYQGKKYETTKKVVMSGKPIKRKVSTTYIERQNLTMRMGMRRFTRKTNAFSKKLENHKHAIDLHFFYYNFVRIHKTLKITPAMAAGISHVPMKLEWLAEMTC